MYERFNELGIPVKITRTTDEYLPKTERVNRVNELYPNDQNVILISNHINAGGGEFTYHYIIWLGIKTAVFRQLNINLERY